MPTSRDSISVNFPHRAAALVRRGAVALLVIVAVAGVATTIWRMSVLRSGGLNPFVAREQLEARLNQSLQERSPEAAERSIEQRLAELEDLHERGVISDAELTAARAKIIADG